MWFVLVTLILARPTSEPIGERGAENIGDVVMSTLIGAAETREECGIAGRASARAFERRGEGVVVVTHSCVELPAAAGDAQGFGSLETGDGT